MKVYKVKVNGKVYEVELEKVTETGGSVEVSATTEAKTVSADANTVNSPLQGKIFKLPVKVGDTVKSGDVVAIIEAMKMESEVQTSQSGTVKEILVSVGSEVDSNQPLVVIG